MYNSTMLHCSHILLCLLILLIKFSFVTTSIILNKKNITLITPSDTSLATTTPHKSIHVKYRLSDKEDRWSIVGFEPMIQLHRKVLERLTVHLYNGSMHNSISYDDMMPFDSPQAMLIYEWTPYSSSSPVRLSDGIGFTLAKYKLIVLSVIYKKEKETHKEQSGVVLYISNKRPKFQMGTILVGNTKGGTHFSCRSSDVPRLLYGIKRLHSKEYNFWWRINVIRARYFRRKLIQTVLDSRSLSNMNQTAIDVLQSEVFLLENDYLLIECEPVTHVKCYFLIYYTYKSEFNKNDNICQDNEFSHLFKVLAPIDASDENEAMVNKSNTSGSTIFLIVVLILLFIWISIIIGCIIMRRIRGLVNFRTETASPSASQKNVMPTAERTNDNYQQRQGETDQMVQMEIENAALIS